MRYLPRLARVRHAHFQSVDSAWPVRFYGKCAWPTLPSGEPLDAKRFAKQIRDSIVVLTQFGRDDNEEGVGTGFVVSADGLIATSLHVIGKGGRCRCA